MKQLSSALYAGRVRHSRLDPFSHRFEYRVFYGLFDIDELEALDRTSRWFSLGRFNLFSLEPRDHGLRDGRDLRAWAERLLREAGIDIAGGRIKLLAFPRILGYAFNPISVWYCYDPAGELRGVLHEVRNTFGHRHTYVAAVDAANLAHSFTKQLHVSPFNDMNEAYSFTISPPGDRLTIAIDHTGHDQIKFRAGLALQRLPFNDRNLRRLFLTHPLLTIKVIGGIHWQALRLWLKGAKYRPVPPPPAAAYTVVRSRAEAA
jgi:DUF1365 family protein